MISSQILALLVILFKLVESNPLHCWNFASASPSDECDSSSVMIKQSKSVLL